MEFRAVKRSLVDLLGSDYLDAVCRAQALLSGCPESDLQALSREPVDFWPTDMQRHLHTLLPHVGGRVAAPLAVSPAGAGTAAFCAVSKSAMAPVSGLGYYRISEDGRLFVIAKSEHYHVLLGHGFPGYRLLEHARRLGIPNATHNNTRGPVVRKLEESLIRLANGMGEQDPLTALVPDQLSRVINIETGSLAAETALKLALVRFYDTEAGGPAAPYADRVPVILVVGNDAGGLQGNYHGTTLMPQLMRGMWPGLLGRMAPGTFRVVAVRPNSMEDLEAAFREHERAPAKIAAFFHEMVMMNYGALVMTPEFLERAYALCREHDVPTVADEIQSCMWYPEGFLYRRYGLAPSIVVVGKGFSGGEYAASRVLVTEAFDRLSQFGALVTNGQEELASLAYLITMTWVRENRPAVEAMGRVIEAGIRSLTGEFPGVLAGASGCGHLMGLRFRDIDTGKRFAEAMVQRGYDISVQSYKAVCPPVALIKLPLVADEPVVENMVGRMCDVLQRLA
ncbi:MAG: hypothetical protein A2498_03735 [Lentisphaerae bacterium RIFOXYC12_FULL_60_16]|nr:MAG: hypothetical protein A2498_03735 [Lentisphaerae bacterium RIFOXYC12_FULL_60_16]OGV86011.1 MAG: hypothetical protein A2340_08535 [Lentisphaerae bacterium RIFOXYB12_FULL_60_10]